MKFSAVAFLAFAASTTNAFECADCFEDLDETRDCLRICNAEFVDPLDDQSGSLLDACIEATEGKSNDSPFDEVKDIEEFAECCRMDKDCEDQLEDAEECVAECMPTCIKDTPREYLDCISDEMDKDEDKCGRQACLDGFLEEDGLQDELGLSGDILELKNLEKRLKKIETEDLEDCSLLEDFVDEVCEIGDSCCEKCNEELAVVVDCVINEVVIPFVAIELNETIAECPIDTDKCELARRELSETQVDKVNAIFQKSGSSKQLPSKRNLARKARALQAVEGCEQDLKNGIVLTNSTDGANKFMDCVVSAAGDALADDGGEEGDDDVEESGAVRMGVAGVAAAVAAMLL